MIEPGYVREMARYNAWQNKQIHGFVKEMKPAELKKDRGAFFGSIFATLNHLLWGDTLWMSRFDPSVDAPEGDLKNHTSLTKTVGDWSALRFRLDGKIQHWAKSLSHLDLQGDLEWYSGAMKRNMRAPMDTCIVGFFNHQTHHRGQVHAMLTSTGSKAPVSDLIFMPES